MSLIEMWRRAGRTPLTYPISTVWAAGAGVAVGLSRGWFDLGIGLGLLSFITLLVFLISLRVEVASVHSLVNSQRDELLARIDTLVDYLIAAGVDLPPGETHETRAGDHK